MHSVQCVGERIAPFSDYRSENCVADNGDFQQNMWAEMVFRNKKDH